MMESKPLSFIRDDNYPYSRTRRCVHATRDTSTNNVKPPTTLTFCHFSSSLGKTLSQADTPFFIRASKFRLRLDII